MTNTVELFLPEYGKLDIDNNISIPFTTQFEDLQNPSAIKNNFSKTLSIPSTPNNDKIFSHIWSTDSVIYDFDPSQRLDFALVINGDVITTGYLKVDSIDIVKGLAKSYNVTLYGGLGDFFYTISEKYMNDLDVDPDNYDHNINAQAVYDSWSNEYYCYPLTYSGLYNNFDSDSVYNILDMQLTYGISNIIERDGKFIAVTQNAVLVYTFEDGLSIYGLTFNFEAESGNYLRIMYDEIDNRLYVITINGSKIYYTTNLTDFKEWSYYEPLDATRRIADLSIIDDDIAKFAILTTLSMVYTGNDLASLENKGTLSQYGLFIGAARLNRFKFDGQLTIHNYASGISTIQGIGRGLVYFNMGRAGTIGNIHTILITDVQQTSSDLLIYDNKGIQDPNATNDPFIIVSSANNIFYGNVKDNSEDPTFRQYSNQTVVIFNTVERQNDYRVIVSGMEASVLIQPGQTTSGLELLGRRETGFNILSYARATKDTEFNDVIVYLDNTTAQYKIAQRTTTDNPYVEFTPINDYYYKLDLDNPLNEHQRNEYRSYYQRPMLRMKYLISQILIDSGFEYELDDNFFNDTNPYWQQMWCIMSRLSYEGVPPENHVGNIRSNDPVTFSMMMQSGISQLDFLLSFCKEFRLIFVKDKIEDKVSIMYASTYFKNYTIDNWNEKIDYSKNVNIKPIPYDFKYISLKYEYANSYYEELYRELYNIEYGQTRVNTNYYFNNNENLLFDSVFQNVVMSMEYDRYFEGRNVFYKYADDKVLPALFTKSNNQMNYNDSSLHLIFKDTELFHTVVPVRITDDSELMLNLGLFMWNDSNVGTITTDLIPRLMRVNNFGTPPNQIFASLDFSKPNETYYPTTDSEYPEYSTVYHRFFKYWIEERYDKDNKVLIGYFDLSPSEYQQFQFYKFVVLDDTLFAINKISNFNPNDDNTTQCELIRIKDITKYYTQYGDRTSSSTER